MNTRAMTFLFLSTQTKEKDVRDSKPRGCWLLLAKEILTSPQHACVVWLQISDQVAQRRMGSQIKGPAPAPARVRLVPM